MVLLTVVMLAVEPVSSILFPLNRNEEESIIKQEIRSVEHGVCPIAEFTSPY